jgi:hypothetical protein
MCGVDGGTSAGLIRGIRGISLPDRRYGESCSTRLFHCWSSEYWKTEARRCEGWRIHHTVVPGLHCMLTAPSCLLEMLNNQTELETWARSCFLCTHRDRRKDLEAELAHTSAGPP